jgi:hypothetical protein
MEARVLPISRSFYQTVLDPVAVNLPGHRPGLLGAPSRQLRRATPLSSAASQRCLKKIHIPPRPQVGASCIFFVNVFYVLDAVPLIPDMMFPETPLPYSLPFCRRKLETTL